MDVSTLLLGALMVSLPVIGAILLTVIVLLERPVPVTAPEMPATRRPRRAQARHRR